MLRTFKAELKFALRVAAAAVFAAACGCHRQAIPRSAPLARPPLIRTLVTADLHELPVNLPLTPDQIIASQEKRVLGRASSHDEFVQVAAKMRPLVEIAVDLPEVQKPLEALAQRSGVEPDEMKRKWVSLQEADLALESGGNPNAISYAGACGVAQWMAGPAGKNGLSVDMKRSQMLSNTIAAGNQEIAWLSYLQLHREKAGTPGLPTVTVAVIPQRIQQLQAAIDASTIERARIDERFNPELAIRAQARYLLGLSVKIPSPSWLFQAYHGGEAGVVRLLRAYCGAKWAGSVENAVCASTANSELTFETIYLNVAPRSHAAAFTYLYGRGDDHRHYWWKLLAAERGLALLRTDRAGFDHKCANLMPGKPAAALWYDTKSASPLQDAADEAYAIKQGWLTPVVDRAGIKMASNANSAIGGKGFLQKPAIGTLLLIVAASRQCGGKSVVTVSDTVRTLEQNVQQASQSRVMLSRYPPADVQPSFDFRTVGVAFDLVKPTDKADRKILDYCIGYFEDRNIVVRTESANRDKWQCVPNPSFSSVLAGLADGTEIPALINL